MGINYRIWRERILLVWPGVFLLAAAIVVGLCVYQHYGVSWDETTQREIGITSYNYVFHGDQRLKTYIEKDHGPGIELPLVMIEKAMGLEDSSDIYLMRHLVIHLSFLFSAFCAYMLALRLFKRQSLAVLAFLVIAFHPRLYAHSFFNSKDIPFLSLFIICFTVAEAAFRKGKWHWHLLLGIACGYTTSVRILAIILPVCFGLFYLIDSIVAVRKKEGYGPVFFGTVFLLGYCLSLYASWPVLWTDPLGQLLQNYESMAKFRWHGTELFFGKMEDCTDLPWTYVPGWVSITTPELWLIIGFTGVITLVVRLVSQPRRYFTNTRGRNFVLYLMCCVAPVVAVIGLNSVILDGWRHLYFIFPSFVFIMLSLVHRIRQQKLRLAIAFLAAVQLLDTTYFMMRNHPFQQVYFNRFVSHAPEYLRRNFELDYWACSIKQGYEYLLKQDPHAEIRVWRTFEPIIYNTLILNKDDRNRIILSDRKEDATYFFTVFRGHPGDFPEHGRAVYEIKVLNSTILRVQNMKDSVSAL